MIVDIVDITYYLRSFRKSFKIRRYLRTKHAKGRVAGSTVTNDRQHGALGGMYAHEHYVQPYPVTNS